jgi:ABC-type phosphate/phosphonate transport system substrate-binding protein
LALADVQPVASLPMYDWPEVEAAHQSLWTAIADRLRALGIAAPVSLDQSRNFDAVWRDAGLVLSQTCGFPFSTRLRGIVRLVGTPAYDVPGCDGAYYSSMIVTRGSEPAESLADFKGKRFAYNAADSLSGYLVLRAAMKEARIDPDVATWIETGAHRASVRAVSEDFADVASIDAVCWALALRYEPEAAARLKVIGRTSMRPGLPLITALERSDSEVQTIQAVLKEAVADKATQAAREALHITGLGMFSEFDYGPIAALGRR